METSTGSPRKKRGYSPYKLYTIYLAKDDTILAFGYFHEVCKQLGLCENTVWNLISRARNHQRKKYEVFVYPDDADDEDLEEESVE